LDSRRRQFNKPIESPIPLPIESSIYMDWIGVLSFCGRSPLFPHTKVSHWKSWPQLQTVLRPSSNPEIMSIWKFKGQALKKKAVLLQSLPRNRHGKKFATEVSYGLAWRLEYYHLKGLEIETKLPNSHHITTLQSPNYIITKFTLNYQITLQMFIFLYRTPNNLPIQWRSLAMLPFPIVWLPSHSSQPGGCHVACQCSQSGLQLSPLQTMFLT
jgi:hypothetical protein